MEARKFKNIAAQGDFIIRRIKSLPDDLEKINPTDNKVVVAHSETGHDHVMEADHVVAYKPKGTKEVDLYSLFLLVEEPTEIKHLRSFDTHTPIVVDKGTYEIRRQRESMPEGFRKAQD